eukprot:TRINITY_DN10155_c0_g1_i1.p1 TRINITY_DN10155_c0_g1~~TRINITY_DN10155_c0_g1_i1.p1  ORF type:complete len:111 (+),score=25.13 TRINITY_DN10155_c0_g1_i1:100-432(+)
MAMARSRSPLMALVLCLFGAAFFGPVFIPGSPLKQHARIAEVDGMSALAATATAFGAPLAASAQEELASDGIPEPVLGIGMLSIIVVLVLITSGIVVARGLIADEENGDF